MGSPFSLPTFTIALGPKTQICPINKKQKVERMTTLSKTLMLYFTLHFQSLVRDGIVKRLHFKTQGLHQKCSHLGRVWVALLVALVRYAKNFFRLRGYSSVSRNFWPGRNFWPQAKISAWNSGLEKTSRKFRPEIPGQNFRPRKKCV